MSVPCIILLLVVTFYSISANIPTQTNSTPAIEILDGDHVLVEYSSSFNIHHFSKIKMASVISWNMNYVNKEDFITAHNEANTVDQKLIENAKLKVKMKACQSHRFIVRLTFEKEPQVTGYVDSLEKEYVPGTMEQVKWVRGAVKIKLKKYDLKNPCRD